ncbi:MAG: hypothetical protein ACE5Q6_19400 [Dehalococcoidia bacterium]
MNKKIKTTMILFVALLVIGIGAAGVAYGISGTSPAEAEQTVSTSPVWNWPPPASADNQVGDGFSTLQRDANGVWYSVNTHELNPGVHTLWFVVFNDPASCEGGCGGDDLMGGRGDSAAFWAPGTIIGSNGEGNFGGYIQANYVPAGPDQILKDNTGGLGMTDVENSEIHFVLRTHGSVFDNSGYLGTQLSTFNGGCNPNPEACQNVQFSIHKVAADQ